MWLTKILAVAAIAATFSDVAMAENILFLLPIATKSHRNVFDPIIEAFAAKGHTITVASPFLSKKTASNVKEIVPIQSEDLFPQMPDPFEQRRMGRFNFITNQSAWGFMFTACEKAYKNPEFMDLLNQKFDLIFWNAFVNNCFDGMLHLLKAPFISVTAQAAPNYITSWVGNRQPVSFVPASLFDYSDAMTFGQRTMNLVMDLTFEVFGRLILHPKYERIYREKLGAELPSVDEIEANASMIFSNSYFPLTFARPLLPQVIEVGGMHCKPAKPLPKDLDDFLSGAKDGFILFSMGSVVNTDKMPEDMRLKFLNVFAKLKQRVIWKWNSGKMENLPPNVRVSSWLPQQDILGHRNIKLFITHGGLLSTQEAAYHGVPLLGIPVFADQDLNMKQAERAGYALTLEVLDFTQEGFHDLINELLTNPKYLEKARHLSSVIQDQPQTPLERAVFWSEYVIRHKGAVHMRSAARNLNFFQYHSLDVIAFLISVVSLVLAILYLIMRSCLRCCCRRCFRSKASLPKKVKKN